MFMQAIETVSRFTRPIHFISRNFESQNVIPGAATLFFINNAGWAFTCRHVASEILAAEQVNARYESYKLELQQTPSANRSVRRQLEKKFALTTKTVAQLKARLIGCGEGDFELEVTSHASYDVALLHFSSAKDSPFANPQQTYPMFARHSDQLKQGKTLCRLGFPFAEFENYAYNAATDSIDWATAGKEHTPQFPIDGMVTRHLADHAGKVFGFEMSTPGLRGQSGGPAFDAAGTVWGMQFATNHLDLNFDIDQEVLRRGIKERRQDSAFLHVGNCIHVDVLKDMMRQHGVSFSEA